MLESKDVGAYISFMLAKTFHYLMPNIFNIKDLIRYKYYRRLQGDYLNAGALKQSLINTLKEDITSDLPKVKTDTLLLWGEKDTNAESTLALGRKMYRLIPRARIETFEEAGHHPHIDNPKMFVYWVRDFAS